MIFRTVGAVHPNERPARLMVVSEPKDHEASTVERRYRVDRERCS
jgi:hypothetical protein